jgi:RHS repeat-associated protein
VTESISYDAWGMPTYSGSIDNRLMWKGLMWEGGPAQGDVVGLSYVRGRWYDPQAGRFIQEDPISVDGGVNVYLFAGDDPVNGSDPSGMGECWYEVVITHYENGEITSTEEYGTGFHVCGEDGGGEQAIGGGGGGDGGNVTQQPTPNPKRECIATVGAGGAIGGLVLPILGISAFYSGSISLGVSTGGTFFWQANSATELGAGLFAGAGAVVSLGRGRPVTAGTARNYQAEVNGGWGQTYGGSVAIDQNDANGWSVSSPLNVKGGWGGGGMVGVGQATTSTHVLGHSRQLGRLLTKATGGVCK